MINDYVFVHVLVQSILLQHLVSIFMYVHVHGAVSPDVNGWVVSSSPVGGSRTLQSGIKAYVTALVLNGP